MYDGRGRDTGIETSQNLSTPWISTSSVRESDLRLQALNYSRATWIMIYDLSDIVATLILADVDRPNCVRSYLRSAARQEGPANVPRCISSDRADLLCHTVRKGDEPVDRATRGEATSSDNKQRSQLLPRDREHSDCGQSAGAIVIDHFANAVALQARGHIYGPYHGEAYLRRAVRSKRPANIAISVGVDRTNLLG